MAQIQVTLDVAALNRQIAQINRNLQGIGQNRPLRGVSEGIDNTTASARRASGVFTDLKGLLVTLVTAATLRQITGFAEAFTQVENRVKAVVPAGQDLGGVIGALADVSRETGTQFESIVQTFQRFTFATKELGLSQNQVIDLVETLNKGFRVYGATATEAASVSLQLGQALASGRLQGDELRSVLEGFPPLVQAIADVMGIAAGEVKNFASEGKISSEIVVQALQSIQEETNSAADNLERTIGQATQGLRTSFIELAGVLDETTGFSSGLVTILDAVSEGMQRAVEETSQFSTELSRSQTALGDFEIVNRAVFDRIIDGVGELIVEYGDLASTIGDFVGIDDGFLALAEAVFDVGDSLEGTSDSADGLFASLTGLGGFDDIFDGLSDGGELFVDILGQVGTDIADLAGDLADFLDLDSIFSGQFDGAETFIFTLRQVGADLLDLGREFLEFSGIASVFDDVKDKLSDAGEEAGSLLERFGDFTGLSGLFEPTSAAVDDLGFSFRTAGGFGAAFGTVLADAGDDADESGNAFSGFGKILDDLGDSLRTVFIGAADGSEKSREELAALAGEIARVEVGLQDLSGGAGDYAQAARDISVVTKIAAADQKALDKQAKDLADTFGFLARTTRDAALAANDFDDSLEKLEGVFDDFEKETKVLEANFRSLATTLGGVFELSGVEAEQFFTNVRRLLNGLGGDFSFTFRSIATTIADTFNLSQAQLDGFFGLATKLLDGLGVEFEDIFGKKITAIIRQFAQFTDNEIGVLRDIFGGLSTAISDIGGTFASIQGTASAFFSSISTGASTAATALAPVALAIAGIGIIVTGTLAIFGQFGSGVQKIATALAVVFAPFVFSIQLIIRLVQFLSDGFSNLGKVGSAIADGLKIAFEIITAPIRIIIEAVRFLTGLFTNLGSVGDTVAKLLAVVLAPIVIPIRLIIEAVRFLIDLFSNLGSVGSTVSRLLAVVLAPIVIPIRLIIEAVRFLIDLFSNLGSAARLVGRIVGAVFNTLAGIAAAVFNSIANVAQQAFNSIVSFARSAASAAGSALRSLASEARDVFNSISAGTRRVADSIRNPAPPGTGERVLLGQNPTEFAKGGVIEGPTLLDGPEVAGQEFRRGTVLGSPTLLGNATNVSATSQLGLAGEAGPEGILPLAQTSRGLGVTATGVGGNRTQIFIINGVDRALTDQIEQSVLQLNAEVEFRSAQSAQQLLLGAV